VAKYSLYGTSKYITNMFLSYRSSGVEVTSGPTDWNNTSTDNQTLPQFPHGMPPVHPPRYALLGYDVQTVLVILHSWDDGMKRNNVTTYSLEMLDDM